MLAKVQVNLLTVVFDVKNHENLSEYLLIIQDLEYQEETGNEEYVKFKQITVENSRELNKIASNAAKIITLVDDGAPYMNLQTYNTVSLAYRCKVSNMEILAFSLFIDEHESGMLSTKLISISIQEIETLHATIRLESPEVLKAIVLSLIHI